MILIGAGGHADDIAEFMPWVERVDHHSGYRAGGFIIGINDPQTRARIANELGRRDSAWVHPGAKLYHDVTYDYGTHINYGVAAVRTRIGRHCTIAPGVTICGDVVIGDRVFVGAGATISNLVTIGDDVTIGAGAVVLHDVTEGQTVAGIPARPI